MNECYRHQVGHINLVAVAKVRNGERFVHRNSHRLLKAFQHNNLPVSSKTKWEIDTEKELKLKLKTKTENGKQKIK
jgi:hypothetical protein